MATILVNPDGSSNAKIGDVVVTGGGLYKKTATGSVKLSDLPGGNTGDYNVVKAAYAGLTSGSGSGSTKSPAELLNSTKDFITAKTTVTGGGSSGGLATVSQGSTYTTAAPAAAATGSAAGSDNSNLIFGIAGLLFLVLLLKR